MGHYFLDRRYYTTFYLICLDPSYLQIQILVQVVVSIPIHCVRINIWRILDLNLDPSFKNLRISDPGDLDPDPTLEKIWIRIRPSKTTWIRVDQVKFNLNFLMK